MLRRIQFAYRTFRRSTDSTSGLVKSRSRSTNGKPHETISLQEENGDCVDCGHFEVQSAGLDIVICVASNGNLPEFEKLYNADESRLHLQDAKGQTVLHHAATRGRIPIMQFIISHGGDINCQDKQGNTALHLAVEKAMAESVTFLLSNGIDSSILNKKECGAIQVAVELDLPDILEIMCKHKSVNVNLAGEAGKVPLYYAAASERPQCAKILLENGACPCIPCCVGYYPMHIAATKGSSKTLEVLVTYSEKRGYKRTDILSKLDKDKNMPLHMAVNGGDIEAVRVCLNAGAKIDAQQDDKSTPVHLACSQGSLEMIKVMFEIQPESKQTSITSRDVMLRTPLHIAAVYDHVRIVEYLTEQGADIDVRDDECQTPLLLATSKSGWKTVKFLLGKGVQIDITDNKNRNFLHLAIMNNCDLGEFGNFELMNKAIKCLLDDKDDFGCTPLHYASKGGHLACLDDLIKLGACLNTKNNDKQSPLHFAARFGRTNTCIRLLDSPLGPTIINETDGDGLTPLHIASQSGHVRVVQLLLTKGALIHRDFCGNSPLHLAAENGYTHTMRVLLGLHPHLLNVVNKTGNTSLHLAAQGGHVGAVTVLMSLNAEFTVNKDNFHFFDYAITLKHKDLATAIVAHDRWREAMDIYSQQEYTIPMLGLIKYLPEVCSAVMDRCQTSVGKDPKDKDFHYHYDFRYLQCPIKLQTERQELGEELLPLTALNMMVKFNRVSCLSHPLCVLFLLMKWRAYGCIVHSINLVFYMIFLVCLTSFVCTTPTTHYDHGHYNRNLVSMPNVTIPDPTIRQYDDSQKVSLWTMAIFCCLNMLKEIGQMIQQRMKYFKDLNNYLEWVLYISSVLFTVPAILGYSTHSMWEFCAVAVFLAWFNLLLYLQRFDFFGIYVVMFLEILKTLIQVLIVFSILIVAFGLSFYILLSEEETHSHRTPGLSLMRIGVMMLGEIDYVATFIEPYADSTRPRMHFEAPSFVLLVIFILLMPILLMNLLIGLAVGDIEAVQRNAGLKRLAMQVELHSDLETKLPRKLLAYVDKSDFDVYPNCKRYFIHNLWLRLTKVGSAGGGDNDENAPLVVGPTDSAQQQATLFEEMYKQKRRLRDITSSLDKQHDLLRLIVQKMEIKTEADVRDEGESSGSISPIVRGNYGSSWTTPAVRNTLLRQAAVMAYWQKSTEN